MTLAAVAMASVASAAEPIEAWRTSPFHGLISDATGKPIPCTCRYRERSYNLGEKVCLKTMDGAVLARCDLHQNITTWVPTTEACTISWLSRPPNR